MELAAMAEKEVVRVQRQLHPSGVHIITLEIN